MNYELNDWKRPLLDLESNNRNPDVLETYAVPSSSRDDIAHVVRKIEHLTKPLQDADAVEDKTVTWVGSCEDTQYNRWGSDGTIPVDYTPCRHVIEEFKQARVDESQTELTFQE